MCINVCKLELKCVKYSRKFSKKKSVSAILAPFCLSLRKIGI